LKRRDRGVFEEARRRKIPVATTLAGGYARRVEDHHSDPRQYDPGGPGNGREISASFIEGELV